MFIAHNEECKKWRKRTFLNQNVFILTFWFRKGVGGDLLHEVTASTERRRLRGMLLHTDLQQAKKKIEIPILV